MDAGMEVHQTVDIIFKTIQVSDLHNSDCVGKFVVLCIIGLCSLSTVTKIIVGVNAVTFIIGATLGVLLSFLILCIYIRRHYKPSLNPVHVPKPSHPLHQSSEYQDVHLKPASTIIPVTHNTAYGCGRRVLDKGKQQKEIELEGNVAYGSN